MRRISSKKVRKLLNEQQLAFLRLAAIADGHKASVKLTQWKVRLVVLYDTHHAKKKCAYFLEDIV